MEEEKNENKEMVEKKKKGNKFLIVALVIILTFGFAYLGASVALNNKVDNETVKKPNNDNKKTDIELKNEEEEYKADDVIAVDAKSFLELGYAAIPVKEQIFSGKDLDLTTLPDNIKMVWVLNIIDKSLTIPTCSNEVLELYGPSIIQLSFFEDNSFIDTVKTIDKDDQVGTYSYTYENDVFLIKNNDCDEYGPGPSPAEYIEVEKATKKGDKLTLDVKFVYYTYEGYDEENNTYLYTARETFDDNGKIIKENIANPSGITDAYAKYQFTFKIGEMSLYPLTVKKI